MNPFQAHKKRERVVSDLSKLAEEADAEDHKQRETECWEAILALTKTYNCEIVGVIVPTRSAILADVMVIANPKQADAPPAPVPPVPQPSQE